MKSYLILFKGNKNFRLLVMAKFLSDLGSQIQRFGLPWLVYKYTNSGSLMAFNFTLTLLPGLLFGFIGGQTSDNINKRKILLFGDLLSCFVTVVLYFLSYFNFNMNTSVIYVFILTFLLSSISSFYSPAFTSIIPNIVSKKDIVEANSIFSVFDSIASLIGPVIATLVISLLGAWITLLFNSLSFAISAILIWLMKVDNVINNIPIARYHLRINFPHVSRILNEFSWLKFFIYIMGIFYIALGCVGSLLQYYFINNLHLKGIALGSTFVLFEFFPVLGASFCVIYFIKKLKYRLVITISVAIFSLSLVGMGITNNYLIVVISGIVQNFFGTIALISWSSIRQERIPKGKLGIVSGIGVTLQACLEPVGGIISSILLSMTNVQIILICSGLICFFSAIFIYAFSLRDLIE